MEKLPLPLLLKFEWVVRVAGTQIDGILGRRIVWLIVILVVDERVAINLWSLAATNNA